MRRAPFREKAAVIWECIYMRTVKDLTGQRFGELTVIGDSGMRGAGGNVLWRCKCSCGKECLVPTSSLHAGLTRSCGHLYARKRKNIAGYRFGRLEAIKPLKQKKRGSIVWICKCDCGSVCLESVSNWGGGFKTSCGCTKNGIAVCPACGEKFRVTPNRKEQFCPECAPQYESRNWNVCAVCRKLFATPASNPKVTCSKECSSKWRKRVHGQFTADT